MSHKFIEQEGECLWFNGNFKSYYCEYTVDNFSDSLFIDDEIHYPETLAAAVAKRKAEFFAGRYCARKVLAFFGQADFQILTGQHRNPLWPEQYVGSISHSNTLAIAIIGKSVDYKGLGIDIEDIVAPDQAGHIASQIMNKEEIIQFQTGIAPGDIGTLFTLIFSAKESFFKAAYSQVGKYFGFKAATVTNIDFSNKKIYIRLNETLSNNLHRNKIIEGSFVFLNKNSIATFVTLPNMHE